MLIINKDHYIDFSLSNENQETINSSNILFSRLYLGNRLVLKKKSFLLNLLLNLKVTYEHWYYLIIPLNKNFYRNTPENQRPEYQTYDIVNGVVKALVNRGYLSVAPAQRLADGDGGYVFVSAGYYPKPSLVPYLDGINLDDIRTARPESFLVLRDKMESYNGEEEGVEIDFPDTNLTKKMKKDLNFYNELRERTKISVKNLPASIFYKHRDGILTQYNSENLRTLVPINNKYSFKFRNTYLFRIFNKNWRRGGRFYRGVESNMPSEIRKRFYIDGRPTVELDYGATHFIMLYNLKGFQLRKDPYIVEPGMSKEMRKLYKKVGFISLNAKNETSALLALHKEIRKNEKFKRLFPNNSKEDRLSLIRKFKQRNTRIQDSLFKEKCHMLTNYDSKIANDVLIHFTKKGIPCLCVHDSFIIQRIHKDELQKVMKKFYKERFGFNPKVNEK